MCESPAFAYASILLLQAKILSGFIRFPELTTGDTSSYFTMAYDWHHAGRTVLSWSPLYTSFYGAFFHLSDDAAVVTVAHRLAIVMVLAALTLALMRRLLPPDAAWLMTAWWVVMPINFNSLYEVHLFAVIPVLAALLLSLTEAPWGIGAALGVLLASALLMRNELVITFLVLAAAVAIGAVRKRRFRVGPYLIPVLIALSFFGFFSSRARDWPDLGPALDRKHTLNVCQVYAFGYQQRHSDFSGSPWTECQQLMSRVYGDPEPSLATALRKNPQAMMEHFIWNVRLIPSGLQLLLFNATSGAVNPDYVPVLTHSRTVLWSSITLTILIVCGAALMFREPHYWRENLLNRHSWFWVTAAGLAVTSMWVMVTQRPRASYQLAFGIVIRAALGFLLMAIIRRLTIASKLRCLYPVLVIAVIFWMPAYHPGDSGGRGLLEAYRRLHAFDKLFREPGVKLVTAGWSSELCSYLTGSGSSCQPLDYTAIRKAVSSGTPIPDALRSSGVNVFYADANTLHDPAVRDFIRNASQAGWIAIALQLSGDQSWTLLAEESRVNRWVALRKTGRPR